MSSRGRGSFSTVVRAGFIALCAAVALGARADQSRQEGKGGEARQPTVQAPGGRTPDSASYRTVFLNLSHPCDPAENGRKGEVCDPREADEPFWVALFDWLNAHNGTVSAFAGIAVAIFTWRLIVVGRDQHTAAMGALKLSRDGFNATHRPIIRLRGAILDRWGSDTIPSPTDSFSGKFIIDNVGHTAANIIDSHFELCWSDSGIPIHTLYETIQTNNSSIKFRMNIVPGRVKVVDFDKLNCVVFADTNIKGRITDPTNVDLTSIGVLKSSIWQLNPGTPRTLYLFGWIRFLDANEIERQISFCRRYEPKCWAFRSVDDPELETSAYGD
jgi:hypothetical protein